MKIVRAVLALAVALWMAGAGCMLGCENMVSAAASDKHSTASAQIIVASGEACASMQSHNCCAKRGAKSASKPAHKPAETLTGSIAPATRAIAAESGVSSSPMMDCPLAVNATAALSKPRQDQSSIALPSDDATASVSNTIEQSIAFARPLRLPNRGHTYLRCCVFLI
ncbi:MAG TPA: hypothetical protein VGW76_13695 [Pyrinomonadaceae bacterium]|nr:hypothetical protein [Pyrinomonadaceae bacterium]